MKRVIITLHGIESRGEWQKQAAPLLAHQGWIPYPLDYGSFSTANFLVPFSRWRKVDWFKEQYQRICDTERVSRPSVIAHSFGSFLVAQAMEKYDWLRFDKVLFCGSIVRPTYPWATIIEKQQVNAVRNEYGSLDFWAGVVRFFVPRAGPSGRVGFRDVPEGVHNHRFLYGHSEYFSPGHYQAHWIPFLRTIMFQGHELRGVNNILDVLVQRVASLLSVPLENVRANLMVPLDGDSLGIVPGAHHNMLNAEELTIRIPIGQGCAGGAFISQRPHAATSARGWDSAPLPYDQRIKLDPALRWVISMPIPDPDNGSHILGVLNVDGLHNELANETLVETEVLSILRTASLTIAGIASFSKS